MNSLEQTAIDAAALSLFTILGAIVVFAFFACVDWLLAKLYRKLHIEDKMKRLRGDL